MSELSQDQGEGGAPPDGGMAAEQAADFASIMADVEAPEAVQAAQVEKQQAADMQSMVAENAMALEAAWDLLGGLLPEKVSERYGPEQRARIAASGTALAVKRGWSAGEFMQQWGAEIAFAAALAGPVVPLVLEAFKNRKKDQPDPTAPVIEPPEPVPVAADQEPGAKTVTFGTVEPAAKARSRSRKP